MRSLRAMPHHATRNPRTAVNNTCPQPAAIVIKSVFDLSHFCARAVSTNGNQCVGRAAWKKATEKPVAAMAKNASEFIGETVLTTSKAQWSHRDSRWSRDALIASAGSRIVFDCDQPFTKRFSDRDPRGCHRLQLHKRKRIRPGGNSGKLLQRR